MHKHTEEFYLRFVRYFQAEGCVFPASTETEIRATGMPFWTRVLASGGGVLGGLCTGYSARFTDENVRAELFRLGHHCDLVSVKCDGLAPLLIVTMEADDLSNEELVGRFAFRDEATARFKDFAPRLGIAYGQKLGVDCHAFVVAATSTRALSFEVNAQEKCKRFHFWRKVHVLPWSVDLESRRLTQFPGLPLALGFLSAEKMAHALFQ